MSRLLTQALKTIEFYKVTNLHHNELLDILGDILLLRQEHKNSIENILFPVDERLIAAKLRGGFPLIDFSRIEFDFTRPREYFLSLLNMADQKGYIEATELAQKIVSGRVDFEKLLSGAINLNADGELPEDEEDVAFELIDFLLDECLRPELEKVAEKYAEIIGATGWTEGYCPICGEEPKIGEIKDDDEIRHLFCYHCGFKWSFDPVKCPFCGNQEYQSLAYFTIESEERYRVDVCNSCNRYIKMVDFRDTGLQANLDVEDVATLHLDLLAYEEGYN